MDTDTYFRELAKTEDGCLQLLRMVKYGGSFQCPHCGGTEYTSISTRKRVNVCATCHDQESLTAGTLFERAQIPLTKIFHLVFNVCSKECDSAAQLAKTLDISPPTVLRWLHRIRFVIESSFAPADQQSVHCHAMRKVLFKRSCESSPDLDAVFDMETIDSPMVDAGKTSESGAPVVDGDKTSESDAGAVCENATEPAPEITPKPDRADGNAKGPSSTQTQFGAQSLSNSDRFQIRTSADINMQHIPPTIDGSLVAELIRFIAVIFQGVSRKFAQLYAAQFSFIKLHAGQFRALFTACVRAGPISDIETMLYTSGQYITLPIGN